MNFNPNEHPPTHCKHGMPLDEECSLCIKEIEYLDRYGRFTHDEDKEPPEEGEDDP